MEASRGEQHSSHLRQYRFDDFLLDLDAGFLRRRGDEIALRRKAFDVLAYLVDRHGRLVTKNELTEAVWPDTAVTDNSLAQCLFELRRALGDSSQQMIRTVPRRGYVFAPQVLRGTSDPVSTSPTIPEPNSQFLARRSWIAVISIAIAALAAAAVARWPDRSVNPPAPYTRLTDFADAAVSPALSPDGRMLAFIRGEDTFETRGEIYVRMLPDGEPLQLTHDGGFKSTPAFSPDGSRIAYTILGDHWRYDTWRVPVLGGSATRMPNARGVCVYQSHDQQEHLPSSCAVNGHALRELASNNPPADTCFARFRATTL